MPMGESADMASIGKAVLCNMWSSLRAIGIQPAQPGYFSGEGKKHIGMGFTQGNSLLNMRLNEIMLNTTIPANVAMRSAISKVRPGIYC